MQAARPLVSLFLSPRRENAYRLQVFGTALLQSRRVPHSFSYLTFNEPPAKVVARRARLVKRPVQVLGIDE